MLFSEILGQELTNIVIAIASAIIVYFAWRSTNVREERRLPASTAVLIIENNRRRLVDTNPRESFSNARSSSSQSNYSNATEEIEIDADRESFTPLEDLQISEPPNLQAIIDEVADLTTGTSLTHHNYESVEEDLIDYLEDSDDIPQQIIEDMDNPDTAEGLRRRRLAFYDRESNRQPIVDDTSSNSTPNPSNQQPETVQPVKIRRENLNVQNDADDQVDNSHAENCSNENNENENISKTESRSLAHSIEAPTLQTPSPTDEITDEFRIKLKYLNDELRLVKGSPNEAIGDFKKRNFTVEIGAQKLVRLVFNGHVLQPDSKTLQACGLFDNCVVHCLIHNKKPTAENLNNNTRNNQMQNQNTNGQGGIGATSFSERSGNGPLLIYLGMVLISIAIVFCWYCRFQYSYLFSWYSTSGLVLMTVLFLVMFPLIILIEREVSP